MAFIRNYAEQGDPFPLRTMRAGRLQRRPVALPLHLRALGRKSRARLVYARPRTTLAAGDPFRLRLPKFVRKLSLKKVVSGVGKLAKAALPIAAPFIPGVGPLIAPLLGGALAGGGGPDTPAPELVQQPEPTGPPGQVYRQGDYVLPEVEVTPDEEDYSDDEDYSGEDDYSAEDDYSDSYDEED